MATTRASFFTIAGNATASYEPPFDETGIIVSALIIFTFLAIGLVGNSLTIAVILTYRTLSENVFMQFILSLCVSDLISALISWLFLYRRTWGFDRWDPIPDVFCKFYWAADIMTSYVTALHILSFAVLRFISIQFPILYNKIKRRHSNIWIGVIWALCFLCAFIPCSIIFGSGQPDRNSSAQNSRWPACTVLLDKLDTYKVFQKVTYPIFLYVPTVGVVAVCILIVALVRNRARKVSESRRQEKRKDKEKQAVLQLVLIILSFLLGYIPFTAYEFWSVQDLAKTRQNFLTDYWFGMIEYLFLRFSECLNPLFYNLGSEKVRRHTKKFLKTRVLRCIQWKKKTPTVTMNLRSTASSDALSTTGTNLGV